MAIARWTPFSEMMPLRAAMNDLLEQSLVRPGAGFGASATALALDVYTEGEKYVVEAALPGLAPESVDVTVLGNQVTISGEYAAAEGRQYLFRERPVGKFERTIALPTDVDAEGVQAHYEHGLLRLSVPKAASARPRRIELGANRDN